MEEFLNRWLDDPIVGKVLFALAGMAVVYALSRILHRSVGRYIEDNAARYRARKLVSDQPYPSGTARIGSSLVEC